MWKCKINDWGLLPLHQGFKGVCARFFAVSDPRTSFQRCLCLFLCSFQSMYFISKVFVLVSLQFPIHVLHFKGVCACFFAVSNPCTSKLCPYLCVLSKSGARCLCPHNSNMNNLVSSCEDYGITLRRSFFPLYILFTDVAALPPPPPPLVVSA